MKTIHKYLLEGAPGSPIIIKMQKSAKVLDVQMQSGVPVVWALIDDDSMPVVAREFIVYGTGDEITPEMKHEYIGTFQMKMRGGDSIWAFHLFEVLL